MVGFGASNKVEAGAKLIQSLLLHEWNEVTGAMVRKVEFGSCMAVFPCSNEIAFHNLPI